MPAVATQTGWSWLEDLQEIETLLKTNNVEYRHLSLFASNSEFTRGDSHHTKTSEAPVADLPDSQCKDRLGSRSDTDTDTTSTETETAHVKQETTDFGVDTSDVEIETTDNKDSKVRISSGSTDLILPPLVPRPGAADKPITPEPAPTSDHFPPIFQQLEQFSFSEQETDEVSSDNDSENENTGNSTQSLTMDEIDLHMEKYNKLSTAGKQSGLTIMQYLKESESRYYEYFSMENKDQVDKMIAETRGKTPRSENLGIQSEMATCQFCGETIPKMSLLQVIQEEKEDGTDKKDMFCCESYSEYMVLVAMCMRRMVEEAKNPPKIRKPKPKKKLDKKAMEERALAIARRKQKWEEIQARKRLEAEALRRERKGLATIKFTLLDSDTVEEKGWAIRPESRVMEDTHTTKKKRKESRIKKEKSVTLKEIFSPETLERLQLQAPVSGMLSITTISTFLPDGTGLCNYPSGNLAVVVLSPYVGVLSYLVYEDSHYPQLLCSFDELGRTCLYFADANIHFFSSQNFMVEYNFAGRTEKIAACGGESQVTDMYYKPRTFKLNKYMTLKCSKALSRLFVNFPHCQLKFSAPCKLQKDEVPAYAAKLQEQTLKAESQLATIRARIDEVKHHLPPSRPSRVGRLLPLHGSPINRRSRQRAHTVSYYK